MNFETIFGVVLVGVAVFGFGTAITMLFMAWVYSMFNLAEFALDRYWRPSAWQTVSLLLVAAAASGALGAVSGGLFHLFGIKL